MHDAHNAEMHINVIYTVYTYKQSGVEHISTLNTSHTHKILKVPSIMVDFYVKGLSQEKKKSVIAYD